jgi:hypothetical protein
MPRAVAALATLLLCSPLQQAQADWIAGMYGDTILRIVDGCTRTRAGGARRAVGARICVRGGFAGQAYGVDPLDGTDAEAIFAWIDNYCRSKPLDQLEQAAVVAFVVAHPRSTHPASR